MRALVVLGLGLIFAVGLTLGSCGHVVIRDPNVYRNQINGLSSGAAQMSQGMIMHAEAKARTGDVRGCVALAHQALAINIRAPYHAAMALFLGELGPDPGPAPAIPETEKWCRDRVPDGTVTGTTTWHQPQPPQEQMVIPLLRTGAPQMGRGLVHL